MTSDTESKILPNSAIKAAKSGKCTPFRPSLTPRFSALAGWLAQQVDGRGGRGRHRRTPQEQVADIAGFCGGGQEGGLAGGGGAREERLLSANYSLLHVHWRGCGVHQT